MLLSAKCTAWSFLGSQWLRTVLLIAINLPKASTQSNTLATISTESRSDQYQTQPRHDTTSTPTSRLTLGGFSDKDRSSPTCSGFRDRGSNPVPHHTQLKTRMRLGRILSVLSGARARLGGSTTPESHNGTRDNSRGVNNAAAGII